MSNSNSHIVHIVSTYPPYRGGMGNVAAQMVAGLKEKGARVNVIAPQYGHQPEDDTDAGNIHRLKPWFSYGNSAFVPNMYSLLKKADLIHLHYPFFGGAETVAWFKKKHPNIPLVITYHMDVEGSGLLKAFFQIYAKTFLPWILGKADKICEGITVSPKWSIL